MIGAHHVEAILARAVFIAAAGHPEIAGQAGAAAVDARLVLVLDLVRAGRIGTMPGFAIGTRTIAVRLADGVLRATGAPAGAAAIHVGLVRVRLIVHARIGDRRAGPTTATIVAPRL